MPRFALTLAVAAALAASVAAWCPTSHYLFTCAGLYPNEPVAECLRNRRGLLSATEMPDAFFTGGTFLTGSKCDGYMGLHNIGYAGVLYQVAQETKMAGGPDLTDVAMGFGAHVAADGAGFFPGGLLGSGLMKRPVTGMLFEWSYMTAIDALIARTDLSGIPVPTGMPDFAPSSDAVNALFANASERLHAMDPVFPVIDAPTVGTCVALWREGVDNLLRKAAHMPAPAMLFELQFNNPWNKTVTIDGFSQQLARAKVCAIGSVQAWSNAIRSGATPKAAMDAMIAYLEKKGDACH